MTEGGQCRMLAVLGNSWPSSTEARRIANPFVEDDLRFL